MKTNKPLEQGMVIELLRSAQYRIKIGEKVVRCYMAGKMIKNHIRVSLGDRVLCVVEGEIGRITRRL